MDAMECYLRFFIYFLFLAYKPVIAELPAVGEDCTPGSTYKKDCNSCVCLPNRTYVCSKMACLPNSVVEALRSRKSRPKRQTCVPGDIKKEECSLCFCDDSANATCSVDTCGKESKNNNKLTKSTIADIITIFKAKGDVYPVLYSRLSDCTPGKVYKVDCNTCLCLKNGDMSCDQTLCVDYKETSVWAAKHLNEKPCKAITHIKNETICVQCICLDEKLNCEPLHDCIPKIKRSHWSQRGNRQKVQCEEGTFYKSDCNKCMCVNNALRCTLKTCLSKSQVKQFEQLLKNIHQTQPEQVPPRECQDKVIPELNNNLMDVKEF